MNVEELQIFLLMFADDSILFSQNPQALQSMLNDIQLYCETWGLRLNVNKTKIMIFENGRHTTHNFFIYNQPIEIVSSFKYLGVYFHKNGNWYRTQKRIAQHASYSLHNLFTIFNQIDLPVSKKADLFDTLVFPVLNYAAEIWGAHNGPDIEVIHTKFCRKLLTVKRSTNLDALYGELGRIPMLVQRKIIMVKYWLKILTLDNNSILSKTYRMLKSDLENGLHYNKTNWALHIKNILEECGLTYLWQNQPYIFIHFHTIKQRILDIYYQTWYASINNSTRLQTYNLFKHIFKQEEYLDFIKEKKFRVALTKFRTSAHELEIERGRYTNIARERRLCNHCSCRQVENEYHFLLICKKYTDLRSKYIKRYYYTWPTIQKFTNLMSENSKTTVRNIAKFICFANLRRGNP